MLIQPSKSLLDSILLGYDRKQDLPPEKHDIEFLEGDSTITTVSTCKSKNKNSILESVDTGFSSNNTVVIDCKKRLPKTKVCLFKENYLGEFKNATEKALARFNLDVYSKEEIAEKINNIISTSDLIHAIDLENRLSKLDFVDSSVKSYLKYNIPNNLFAL